MDLVEEQLRNTDLGQYVIGHCPKDKILAGMAKGKGTLTGGPRITQFTRLRKQLGGNPG